jgi:hypothetical protein
MILNNNSYLSASVAGSLFTDGRRGVVVVVKGSWSIPSDGSEPKLLDAKAHMPIQAVDAHTGDPATTAMVFESDYANTKPFCDVLVEGVAYAPEGKAAKRVEVSLELGSIHKSFVVTGPRVWKRAMMGASLSEPKPFLTQHISYDIAFGGTDLTHQEKDNIKACLANPVGLGFMPNFKSGDIEGLPGPQTEESGNPISSTSKTYAPQGFGPIGRGWQPRVNFAGTYDQHWSENLRPDLPKDFDERYYQCAPQDQQTEHLQGGERCTLKGMSERGELSFTIPPLNHHVVVTDDTGATHLLPARADTLTIEPELNRFSIVWRSQYGTNRSPADIKAVDVWPDPPPDSSDNSGSESQ